MGFHAHGKAQNKEATFLAFHPIRKLQELISTRELAIDMEYCDHAQEYSYTHKVTEHRRKQSSGVGGGENSGNGGSDIDQVGKSNQGKEISRKGEHPWIMGARRRNGCRYHKQRNHGNKGSRSRSRT